MDLAEAKMRISRAEADLEDHPVANFAEFATPHGELRVFVTERLRKRCKKERLWKSSAMCTALKNAEYGFDSKASQSRGGSDGIFTVDRSFRPVNSMMKKLFERFLDKPDLLVSEIGSVFGVDSSNWVTVRLVSHHLRLLGVIAIKHGVSHLVLVDCDNEKGG